jgi:hypothetical protein
MSGALTVSFTNKSSIKAQNYSWNFGDGTTSTAKDPVHAFPAYGSYTVTLTAYDVHGCSRMISKKLNLFDPIGIDDVVNAPFTISPNPATESITIFHNQQPARFNIRIANAVGQTVYLAPANSVVSKIDVSGFSSGMYYITLYNDTAVLHRSKFTRQ